MVMRIKDGATTWSMTRDSDGNREYKIAHLVFTDDPGDGPAMALNTPGLPLPGSEWAFDNDSDMWAYCLPTASVTPLVDNGEANTHFRVEQTFSTKSQEGKNQRCNDTQVEDPLLEPQKISGSFTRFSEEATHDLWGRPILSSSLEMIRGPQVEFDRNRPVVRVEQNVAYLGIELFSRMIDTVNDRPMWGLARRCVKLSNVTWEKKFYGRCYIYYTRNLEFEINYDTYDRYVLDEGTKVLHGHWDATTGDWVLDNIAGSPPNRFNPQHFDRFKDRNGENARAVLNGFGLPAGVTVSSGVSIPSNQPYIYINDTASAGRALNNTSYWLPQTSGDAPWFAGTNYLVGNLVVEGVNDDLYIASANNVNSQPPSANWIILPGLGITDVGTYNSSTVYRTGDRVMSPGNDRLTGVGQIYVAKYSETNLFLLGIPAIL